MPPIVRVLTIAFLVAGASSARGQATAALPGWTVTRHLTIDSGDAGHRASLSTRQQVTARRMRMEFVEISGFWPVSLEGTYILIDAVDSTMTMVLPSQHFATVTGLRNSDRVKASVVVSEAHLTRSDLEDLGDGGSLLGHATRHYRLTTEGTLAMLVSGEKCTRPLNAVTEMWIAPDVDLGPTQDAAAEGLAGGGGAPPTSRSGVSPATMPKGTALRSVSKHTAPNATGKIVTATTTTDVVELASLNLDPSVFAVPADFRSMDVRKLAERLPPAMLDSTARASAASSAAAKAMCPGGTR